VLQTFQNEDQRIDRGTTGISMELAKGSESRLHLDQMLQDAALPRNISLLDNSIS
jgi:hypothetical protein